MSDAEELERLMDEIYAWFLATQANRDISTEQKLSDARMLEYWYRNGMVGMPTLSDGRWAIESTEAIELCKKLELARKRIKGADDSSVAGASKAEKDEAIPKTGLYLPTLPSPVSTIQDASQMALDGLSMGYRVLGDRINEALAKCSIKDRIQCGPKRDGDSMKKARNLLIRSLPVLAPLEVRQDEVFSQWPWILGYPGGFGTNEELQSKRWVRRVRLGDDPDMEDSAIEELGTKNNWSSDDWLSMVILPMEIHHAEIASWIKRKCPLGLPSDDTQAAIALCKRWCSVHNDRGGPTEKECDFLEALMELNGSADAQSIAIKSGYEQSSPRTAAQGYMGRINKRAKSESWELAESNSEFHLRMKD